MSGLGEPLAAFRQFHRARAADEEWRLQMLFERTDLMGHCGRGDGELAGRGLEAAKSRRGLEGAER